MRKQHLSAFKGPIRTKTTWGKPDQWQKEALEAGTRIMIFTTGFSDFFHVGADKWRSEAWRIIKRCTALDFQVLTKRPENIPDRLPPDWGDGYDNVWLGVTVENPDYLHRIDQLKQVPAKTRFISAEPLLAPINFDPAAKGIDWMITGCESTGPHSASNRKMNLQWVRDIDDVCIKYGIAHFFKQYEDENGKFHHDKERGQMLDGVMVEEFPASKGKA